MQDDVVALFAYDRWANARVLDACRKLTAEQYVAEPVPGWSSVRSTIYHIAWVTDFHLRTLAGEPDERIPTEADLATVDDALARRLGDAAAVGNAPPHCRSLHLPPRSGRLQAQTVRDRTTDHRLLL